MLSNPAVRRGLAIYRDLSYKHNLVAFLQALVHTATRRRGYLLVLGIAGIYGWVALRGPQGIQALVEKRREIRQLVEQNASVERENQRRREHIRRLEQSQSEQEMEIRKQLKLLRPGETTFILPEASKPADP